MFPEVSDKEYVALTNLHLQYQGNYNYYAERLDPRRNMPSHLVELIASCYDDERITKVYLSQRRRELQYWKRDEKAITDLKVGDFCEYKLPSGLFYAVQISKIQGNLVTILKKKDVFLVDISELLPMGTTCESDDYILYFDYFQLHTKSCKWFQELKTTAICTCAFKIELI